MTLSQCNAQGRSLNVKYNDVILAHSMTLLL